MESRDSVANWVIVGLGLNAFNQLNGEDDSGTQSSLTRGATTGNHIAMFTPQTLMTFSRKTKPNVKISSTWDSVHISSAQSESPEDLCVQTVTKGRWKKILDRSRTKCILTDSAARGEMSTVLETNDFLILSVSTNIFSVSQDSALVSISQEQLPTDPTFSLCADGSLYGLLKNGDLHKFNSSPHSERKDTGSSDVQLLSLGPQIPTNGVCISQVACGASHVLLLSETGAMFSFGLNSRGELGLGDINTRPLPTLVDALDGIKVKDIACGHWHCLALSEYGDVYSWGWNKHGQLGHSKQSPTVPIPTLVEIYSNSLAQYTRVRPTDECDMIKTCEEVYVISVSCGARHSVALSDGGCVYGWGWNGYGQLGGDRDGSVVLFPRSISLSDCTGVALVHCSHWNTLFLCNKLT